MRLTGFAKGFITVVILSVIGYVVYHYRERLIPAAAMKESVVPKSVDLPAAPEGAAAQDVAYDIPGIAPGCEDESEVRFNIWAWNAQMGMIAATGGRQATRGSLMCGRDVNLKLIREDDVAKMQENLVAFASALKGGQANPTAGVHFVAIMGDGAGAFLKGLNDVLKSKLGHEYRAVVVGSCGYSRGEDKFMGLPEWKSNPIASRGGLVAGYLRDGDWNIAQKWLGDNGLRNNPDEKTWDPEALNWVAADSYVDAAKKYVEGWTENRPVVRNGRPTGETRRVTVNGVVTWTPGDVTVAQQKGGLVSIASTQEYSSQMPNVIIGIDRWCKANRATVEGMLSAIMAGGDAVKANRRALEHAAKLSAEVYNEETGQYWLKYFSPVIERDRQGLTVSLGGSYVNNLADNLLLFGMVPGSSNLFAATYTKFGDVVVQQYPELVPDYPPVSEILDISYLRSLAGTGGTQLAAVEREKPKYEQSGEPKAVVGRRSWNITFETGRATFTPEAEQVLQQLARELLVAGGTLVQVHGHTDSVGNPEANQRLSEERAFAVKEWLMQQSTVNFPAERITVHAHGATNPVAPNSTESGRARNRRVEIVLTTG